MQIRGWFEGVKGAVAGGWAQDEADPDARLHVELFAGQRLVARQCASQFREDLQSGNIGDGCHAFQFVLPADLFDGDLHLLSVLVEGQHPLKPENVQFRGLMVCDQAMELHGSVLGFYSPVFTNRTIAFRLRDNGRFLVDVEIQADASGQVMIQLPDSCLDGMPHVLSVRTTAGDLLVGEMAVIVPHLRAPDDVVRRHSGPQVKAGLSAMSAIRYETLRERLAQCLAQPTADAAGLVGQIGALLHAHDQVVKGHLSTSIAFAPLAFPEVATPDVSIVMPVHDKFSVTYNALASLLLAGNRASFELIVVDDGSSDATRDIERVVTGIGCVRHERSEGFVPSCNDGARLARGRYVVMLNNDVEVTRGWLDELIWPFEHFEKVGLVGSRLLYPDGRQQESGGIVWSNGAAWNYGRNANPFEPRYSYTRQVDYASGASLMLPRDLWDTLGGFDTVFAPGYYEDTDLAFRVRQAGYKTLCAPLSQVVHFEGASSGTSVESGMKRYQAINQPKFRARWARAYRDNGIEAGQPDLVKDRNVTARVLMLDVQVPSTDKDAGSYAAVQEMRLLQSLGFKITFASEYLLYQGQYTETLQRMGVECLYAPYYLSFAQVLERRGAEFDLVYVTRYGVALTAVDAIRKWAPRAKIVLNIADLHFLREMRSANLGGDAEQLKKALATRDAELGTLRRVDLVLSYSEVEHAVIASHGAGPIRVAKCPWVVNVDRDAPGLANRKDVAFLGGFGHPPNGEAVTWFIEQVMPLLRQRVPGINFVIYGSNLPESMARLASNDIVVKGYVADVAEVYDTCRVFVAPLLSGAGIKGKVVEALARGVPCVLSPIAAEGIDVRDGVEATIATDPGEWVDHIERLCRDDAAWQAMSIAAQNVARNLYSFDKGRELMRKALEKVEIFADMESAALCPRRDGPA